MSAASLKREAPLPRSSARSMPAAAARPCAGDGLRCAPHAARRGPGSREARPASPLLSHHRTRDPRRNGGSCAMHARACILLLSSCTAARRQALTRLFTLRGARPGASSCPGPGIRQTHARMHAHTRTRTHTCSRVQDRQVPCLSGTSLLLAISAYCMRAY